MKLPTLRPKPLAASVFVLCSGVAARVEAAHPLPEPAPAPSTLHGTLNLELGFTQDRIEGRTNLLAPLYKAADDHDVFFLIGNWSGKGNANQNFSAGLGYRHRFTDPNVILGLNAFYDYGDYSGRGYHQFGVGLEVLSKWFDFRANAYFTSDSVNSFGSYATESVSADSSASTSSQTITIDGGEGNPDIERTTTTTTTTASSRERRSTFARREGVMPGFDLELGGLIPYLDRWMETRLYGGFAYFDEPFGSNDIACFTARLEARPVPAVVLDVQYKGDTRLVDFDNHWFFGVRAEIPFDLGNLATGQSPFAGITAAFTPGAARNRMNEEIVRNWQPTVSRTGFEKTSERRDEQTTTTVEQTVTERTLPQPQ